MAGSLCGIWVDDAGVVHTTIETADGGRAAGMQALRPFAWLNAVPEAAIPVGLTIEALKGEGPFNHAGKKSASAPMSCVRSRVSFCSSSASGCIAR
jgi:hypothetical protein